MQVTRDQFVALHKSICQEALGLWTRKNADYAGSEDIFACLFRSSVVANVSIPQTLLVRLADKLSRLERLTARSPEVQEETARDTVVDAINYLLMLYAWLHAEHEATW